MTESPAQDEQELTAARVEALLFVSSQAVPPSQLAAALEVGHRQVDLALELLERRYQSGSLLRLQRYRGRVQLTTAPETAALIERYLGLDAASRLSEAALETLAIIAYQQPVTRPQIDAIRGVNSDSVLKNLLIKGLVEEGGRAEAPGRPILYSVTPEFLQHFGLNSLSDLPPLETLPEPPPYDPVSGSLADEEVG